jgi:hypothetical protein
MGSKANDAGGESALLLGYAAKLEKALWETGGRINTVLVAQSVLSLIMIAVALGLTSYPSELSVLGFRLGVSLPAFLCGGAVTAACLLMYQIGLVHHEEELLKSVLDIYDLVGLKHASLSRYVAHPLENPGIITTIVALSIKASHAGLAFWVTRIFVLVMFLGLPLLGQIVVAFILIKARVTPWALPVLLTLAISTWYVVLYFGTVNPSQSLGKRIH